MTLLRELSGRMGFDYFRLALIFPSTIQRPDVIIFNGCPQAWVDTYTSSGFFAIDPIVKCAMTRSTPILWADVVNDEARCDEQGREVMQLASEYGILRRHHPALAWSQRSCRPALFITSTPRTQQQWLSAVPFISWLSMHIFEAVARVCLAGLSPHDALSLRELEVCRWAAEGKQVSDIAQILGITPVP